MWRQKRRDQFDKGIHRYGSHDKGDFHDQDQRQDDRNMRERSIDRFRDAYNTDYGEDRVYTEPEADLGYIEDVDKREKRYWEEDPEDIRYREDRGRGGEDTRYREDLGNEEFLDHGEVRDMRDRHFDNVHSGHFEDERGFYRDDQDGYIDDRDDFGDIRGWRDDRPQGSGDWADLRNDEEPYRVDRDEFRDAERDNYRDQDRTSYREEDKLGFRTDRDRERHPFNIEGENFVHKKDVRNRFTDPERGGFRNEPDKHARDRENHKTSTNRIRGEKSWPGQNLPQGRRGSGPTKTVYDLTKGKVAGQRNVVQRLGRRGQPWQRGAVDKRKGPANDRRADFITSTVDHSKNARFISRRGRQTDHRDNSSGKSNKSSDDKKKFEKSVKGHAGSSLRAGQHGETKNSSRKTETVSSPHKESTASKRQHSSRTESKGKSESKVEVKREHKHSHSESDKLRKNSRDQESHDSKSARHNSGHHADSKTEARKIYGSFHEEDAISILADDDRFTHETRRYLGTEKFSSGKVKSESVSKDHSKRKHFGETFQIHTDSSASVYEDKHGNRRRSENTGRRAGQTKDTRKSKSKESYRDKSYHSSKQVRSKGGKVSVPIRKPFRKFGQSRFGNRSENFAFGNRNYISKQNSEQDKGRQQVSQKEKDQALVRIGRTGAILKDDRFSDNLEKDRGGEGNRKNLKTSKKKNDNERFAGRGVHSSNKVKKKYLWKGFGRRGNLSYNKKLRDEEIFFDDDRNEHFSKFRNERDEQDYDKGRSINEEMPSPNEFGSADQNQQVIFIPNADFQDGHTPVLDQYGNTMINPDNLPGSFQQQMPIQIIPSNLAAEAPPGTEYVFIPFVSDPPGGMPENSVNVSNEKPAIKEAGVIESKPEHNATDGTDQEMAGPLKLKPLTKAQRSKIKQRLMQSRRRRMEKRVEKRILEKLMQQTQDMEKEKAVQLTEAKTKPTIKRLSPPVASTSGRVSTRVARGQRQRRQELDDVSADEYENVSDLEDITDDEENGVRSGDYARNGERRQAFRKPGEPRLAMRNKATAGSDRSRGSNSEAWQLSDVRKVVERNTDSQKRAKDSFSDDKSPAVKKMKVGSNSQRNRPRTPIKITVNNDKFVYVEDDNSQDNEIHERSRSRSTEWRSESRKGHDEGRMHSRARGRRDSSTQGKYEKKYRDDKAHYSDRKESSPWRVSPRQNESKRRDGKYDDDRDYIRKTRRSRFSDAEEKTYKKNEPREENQQGQVSNIGQSPGQDTRNNMGINLLQSNFMNSQSQQNFSAPFPQQQMSQTRNQFNSPQSLPFGFQQAGFSQPGFQMGNSDPSLPPVSQGPMNMSPFGQSNLAVHPDMSLPPTVGPVAGTASSMVLPQNSFPQQNLQSQMPMQQAVFPSAMQNQSFAQQQQQVQQMTPSLLGVGPVQTNTAINQQNIQGSMHGSRTSFTTSNPPVYQQSQLRMNPQGGNVQQQSMMGTMVPSGNQGSLQNSLPNQQSRRVLINNAFVSGQQGFVAGHSNSREDSYMPTTLNDAMKNVRNVGSDSSVGASPTIRHQNLQRRQDKPQIYGTIRGAGVLAVPRGSIQTAGVAVRQKAGNQRTDNRPGKGANELFISQPGTSHFGADDIDEEIGELLCIKCDKVFLSESIMRRHSKWHILVEAGVEELRCDTCRQGFTSSVAFNVHMREKHTGNVLKCDKCDLTFTNSTALARHNRAGIHHIK